MLCLPSVRQDRCAARHRAPLPCTGELENKCAMREGQLNFSGLDAALDGCVCRLGTSSLCARKFGRANLRMLPQQNFSDLRSACKPGCAFIAAHPCPRHTSEVSHGAVLLRHCHENLSILAQLHGALSERPLHIAPVPQGWCAIAASASLNLQPKNSRCKGHIRPFLPMRALPDAEPLHRLAKQCSPRQSRGTQGAAGEHPRQPAVAGGSHDYGWAFFCSSLRSIAA